MNDPLLYLFGAVGAVLYAFPMYIAAISVTPPAQPPRFALVMLLFSVFVGGIVSPGLTLMLGYIKGFLVKPTPYPLAVAVGLAINPLSPIFLRKLTSWADAYKIGDK